MAETNQQVKLGIIIGALGVFVAAVAIVVPVVQRRLELADEEAKRPPLLVIPGPRAPLAPDDPIPAPEFIPQGPNLPTLIPFQNLGRHEALVKQVILSNFRWISTPNREPPNGRSVDPSNGSEAGPLSFAIPGPSPTIHSLIGLELKSSDD